MAQPRRNPKARYVLPDVVDPSGVICYAVPVPNNIYHIAAFLGQIKALASAYSWQDDEEHTAVLVADVWKDIFDNLEGCTMQTLLRLSGDCGTIEYSLDNGVSWIPLVNISSCVSSGITEAINDGVLAGPNQQPPQGTVEPQECWTYNVQLNGNGIWHCPVPISADYTVTVESALGGWWDGDINDLIWSCPSGSDYSLGACVGDPEPAQQNDPLQSAGHMRLVGHYSTTWFDAYNTVYEVPTGQGSTELYLQANDGDLHDNQGSITCKVTICNYAEWRKRYYPGITDFVISGYGELIGSAFYGTGYDEIGRNQIDASVPIQGSAGCGLTRVVVTYSTSNGRFGIWQTTNPFTQHDIVEPLPNGTNMTYDIEDISYTFPSGGQLSLKFASYSGDIWIHQMELYGTGIPYPGGVAF